MSPSTLSSPGPADNQVALTSPQADHITIYFEPSSNASLS